MYYNNEELFVSIFCRAYSTMETMHAFMAWVTLPLHRLPIILRPYWAYTLYDKNNFDENVFTKVISFN